MHALRNNIADENIQLQLTLKKKTEDIVKLIEEASTEWSDTLNTTSAILQAHFETKSKDFFEYLNSTAVRLSQTRKEIQELLKWNSIPCVIRPFSY